uniref:Uncharacterized protein n=1 Tax=Glossina pallidipes TaxID=7398 RepID=A0A1B0A962_GLOPL
MCMNTDGGSIATVNTLHCRMLLIAFVCPGIEATDMGYVSRYAFKHTCWKGANDDHDFLNKSILADEAHFELTAYSTACAAARENNRLISLNHAFWSGSDSICATLSALYGYTFLSLWHLCRKNNHVKRRWWIGTVDLPEGDFHLQSEDNRSCINISVLLEHSLEGNSLVGPDFKSTFQAIYHEKRTYQKTKKK